MSTLKTCKAAKEPMVHIGFRVSKSEAEIIKAKAAQYAGGNVSDWARWATINAEPKRSDLTT